MASKGNPYVPEVEHFTNTKEFSYLADFFNKNKAYTLIPSRTYEYKMFWEEVKKYCLEGFTNSVGHRITGHHFFYLNFTRLSGYDEKIGKKTEMFPIFMDLDYDYFHMIEYCEKNQKCLTAVKGRRQGWSYKAAGICSWEYTFFPGSSSLIGTFLSSFALTTMAMARDNLNWMNTHTEFRKQRNPDLKDQVISRYQADIGGVKVWKGYNSQIRAISFKDNPTAAVGKSASKLVLDEAGVFPNITDTWGYTEPLIKEGSIYSGVAIVFGSSGDMDSGSKYFYDMFTNPHKYNMLEFDDPDTPAKKTGYFSSAARGRAGTCRDPESEWYQQLMMDKDGNSNEAAAMDDILYIREQSRGGLDPKALHSAITQFPLTWKEAFLRNEGAIFASPEMLEWLGQLETTPSLREQTEQGHLVWKTEEQEYEFQPDPDLEYITAFPINKEKDSSIGCIGIWERPEKINGEIPYSLYVAGCDPYDQDKSGVGSLGSFFIYKRFISADKTHDIVVAEYTGRPKYADEFYEQCRRLCLYYNAKVLYENQLKGMKNYFMQKNCLHHMWEQPDHMIKDMIKDSKVQRGYGIHMNRGSGTSSGIKDMCELYLKDWLYTERTDLSAKEGDIKFNFHSIKSIALLKELIAYDMEGNFDRVIALMLCILQTKELHKIHVDLMTNSSMSYGNDPFLKKRWERHKTANKIRFN